MNVLPADLNIPQANVGNLWRPVLVELRVAHANGEILTVSKLKCRGTDSQE